MIDIRSVEHSIVKLIISTNQNKQSYTWIFFIDIIPIHANLKKKKKTRAIVKKCPITQFEHQSKVPSDSGLYRANFCRVEINLARKICKFEWKKRESRAFRSPFSRLNASENSLTNANEVTLVDKFNKIVHARN